LTLAHFTSIMQILPSYETSIGITYSQQIYAISRV